VIDALVSLLRSFSHAARESPYDRADAAMDALLRVLAWEDDDAVRTSDAQLAHAYAARAVQNLLIDEYRRESPMREGGAASLPTVVEQQSPQAPIALIEMSERIFAELSEREQDLLHAYFAGPEYFHEEATHQALKPGTARVQIHRLLKRLRMRGASLLADQ
jgi:hypothetical protein